MITETDQKIAEELTQSLLATNGRRITRVILFGSRARGTATLHSDFDVLVVEAGSVSKRAETLRLRRSLCHLALAVDIWVMSEEKYQETKQVVGGLAYPASRHGIVLYENP